MPHARRRDGRPSAAPLRTAPVAVEYPESDGRPMAETPVHMDAMIDAIGALRDRYRHRDDVHVGGNMMMYYREGDTGRSVSPDVFVAFGPAQAPYRRVWKTWVEGKLADFVLEVTSKSSRTRDEQHKRVLYRRLGVTEYWQYDPTGDYLDPILKGRRLSDAGAWEPLPLTTSGGVTSGASRVLGLHLCVYDDRLRLLDPATGRYLPTSEEKDAIIAEQRRIAEEQRRSAEERARALQAEIDELKRLRRD